MWFWVKKKTHTPKIRCEDLLRSQYSVTSVKRKPPWIFQVLISTRYIFTQALKWLGRVSLVDELQSNKSCPHLQGWRDSGIGHHSPWQSLLISECFNMNSGHIHSTSGFLLLLGFWLFFFYGVFNTVANTTWLPAGWNLQLIWKVKKTPLFNRRHPSPIPLQPGQWWPRCVVVMPRCQDGSGAHRRSAFPMFHHWPNRHTACGLPSISVSTQGQGKLPKTENKRTASCPMLQDTWAGPLLPR